MTEAVKHQLPGSLFKYEPPTEQAIDNLRRSLLWYAAPVGFNDPFDCALTVHKPALSDDDLRRLYMREEARVGKAQLGSVFGSHLNPKFRERMTRAIESAFSQQRERHLNGCGVTCFAERGDCPLMWAHYGRSHRGFCVEFDTAHDPFRQSRRVHYADTVPVLDPLDLLQDPLPSDGRFERAMLLTKGSDWAYEKEWRLIHVEANQLLRYEPRALVGIRVGCRATKELEQALVDIARGRGVPVARMSPDTSEFTFMLYQL